MRRPGPLRNSKHSCISSILHEHHITSHAHNNWTTLYCVALIDALWQCHLSTLMIRTYDNCVPMAAFLLEPRLAFRSMHAARSVRASVRASVPHTKF